MLQALRDKTTGWFTTVLLAILAALLVLSGLQGYVYTAFDNSVATIGDAKLSVQDYTDAFSQARDQAVQQGTPITSFDTPEQRRKVLDQLVDTKVFEVAGTDSGLLMSDQAVREQISKDPTFQVDGKFHLETYKTIMSNSRLTEAGLMNLVRENHAKNILPSAVFASAFVTDAEIDSYLKLRDQTRNFRYITIDTNELPAPGANNDAAIKKYYDANTSKFMTPAMADLEYIRIQANNVTVEPVTEALLKAQYDKEANRFKTAEQRQAAHILIEVEGGAGASADKQQAAQKQAQALVERARKGEDFAALAKQYSKDVGSAESGGDLGMLEKGVTEPAFETKLFQMAVGDIADPVSTSQGFHVIKLLAIEPEKGKTFEQARAELEQEFNARAVEVAFNKAVAKAYDASQADPRSLATAAKSVGLTTLRSGMISKQGGGADATWNNPQVLNEAFGDAVFLRGNNSGLINLGPTDAMILRVAQPKPSVAKALAEVRNEIDFTLTSEAQTNALKERAKTLLASMTAGKTLDALASELNKTIETAEGAGRNAANRDAALSAEVFKAVRPAPGKATLFTAVLGADKIALVSITSVTDGNPKTADQATRDSVRDQLRFEHALAEIENIKRAARQARTVTLHEDRLKPAE